jgi:hypothetical protein
VPVQAGNMEAGALPGSVVTIAEMEKQAILKHDPPTEWRQAAGRASASHRQDNSLPQAE